MKMRIPASIAASALFGLMFVGAAAAQIHGVPTSVTSTGFGGHFDKFPGVRTSVTASGPGPVRPSDHAFHPTVGTCCVNTGHPRTPHAGPGRPRPHRGTVGEVYAVPYPVYYGEPAAEEASADVNAPADYAPGPTIFDRGGGNASGYVEPGYADHQRQATPAEQAQAEGAVQNSAPASDLTANDAPAEEQPWTLLMFKDGHQLEVQNYAIVGNMLYDMTPGRRNKVAVADLDINATKKVNDDRGVDFQLPVRTATN